MRKNTARHWLHAALDLLPLLVIPIFALQVRSDNGFEPITIDVQQSESIDFNQKALKFDEVNVSTQVSNVVISENYIEYDIDTQYGHNWAQVYNFEANHKYLFKFDFDRSSTSTTCIFAVSNRPYAAQLYVRTLGAGSVGHNEFIYTFNDSYTTFFTFIGSNTSSHFSFTNFMVFDLTQMFGAGNEPTIVEFNSYFPNDYYDYTLTNRQLIYNTITYSDIDVGSQTIYTLYRTVDNYFNMGNVFNMLNVYQWFSLNIFNGTIPLSIYVVWNIVLYEFVMDLLFLLYGLFMWFIDMCKALIEKPINSIK